MIRCIVGLGNPGPQYAFTRHNIGFMVLDRIALQEHLPWRKRWLKPYRQAQLPRPPLLLCKPATYMNTCGTALAALVRTTGYSPDQLLVIYDDVHLPLGRMRYRTTGSAGGHNGVQSIIDCLDSRDFHRLRLGIGDNLCDRVDHVLSPFAPAEQSTLDSMLAFAADIPALLASADVQHIMQQVNSWHAVDQ